MKDLEELKNSEMSNKLLAQTILDLDLKIWCNFSNPGFQKGTWPPVVQYCSYFTRS